MKKLTPVLCLLLCAALAVGGVWLLGGQAMHSPDADPALVRAGALFSHLRDGQRFSLSDAYPEQWEVAQFAASMSELDRMAQRRLFAYDDSFATIDTNEPMLLLWRDDHVTVALNLPTSISGYPRFEDAWGGRTFEVLRDDATFLCTFVPDASGHGGYYECRIDDEGDKA